MRFGVEIGAAAEVPADRVGPTLTSLARRADAAGLDSVWVWDHFVHPFDWEAPMLEAWTTMGFIAAATSRVRIGTLVNGVSHRYPAVLVKQASTLDVLSGGRAYLGLGAGWHGREHRAFGMAFPSRRERFDLLEDALRIARRAWAGERDRFEGRLVTLDEQIDRPAPLTRPHPPILVGGGGERRTLRLVARYADAANFGSGDPATFARKLEVLRRHCDDVGRDVATIELTTAIDVGAPGDPRRLAPADVLAERIAAMRDAGAQHIIVPLPGMVATDAIERFAAAVSEFREPAA